VNDITEADRASREGSVVHTLRILGIPEDAISPAVEREDPQAAIFEAKVMPTMAERTASAKDVTTATPRSSTASSGPANSTRDGRDRAPERGFERHHRTGLGGITMQITRSSLETAVGPSDWFTGDVYIDTVATAAEPSRLAAASVHFTPGARTAWHTHPLGQTIYVTEGVGRCQRRGGEIEVIRPGDRIYFEPGEDHWQVTDGEYSAKPSPAV
jgi:quercetin dioxygenase-like cupin family protein